MKVFKFGGASMEDAPAIKNVCDIIISATDEKLLVVISAMGKTTDQLEALITARHKKELYLQIMQAIAEYHNTLCNELFESNHGIFTKTQEIIQAIAQELTQDETYEKLYAQILSKGELLASHVITAYLNKRGARAKWLDAREYIRTNNNYRDARVDWKLTEELVRHDLANKAASHVLITQGFIGTSEKHFTTTLGREGSDFSAAIFASCLPAASLTVWKDVPGILNADPKLIPDATLFSELPYKEAAEMTYYGASVIHPKTIKPLANRKIPLHVKSFYHPSEPGTVIHDCQLKELIPTIIIKHNQCLVSFKVLDYTFINEENLSVIFRELSAVDLKINIMQNSAISFSIVVDYDSHKLKNMLDALKAHFDIRYNTGLKLITVKNYAPEVISKYRTDQKILLEQISRNNFRALVAP